MAEGSISIQNIYYLLSYSWNTLEEAAHVRISNDTTKSVQDLLAKVLIGAAEYVLQRGLVHDYVPISDQIAGVKGKVQVAETIRLNAHLRLSTVCLFDEYSPDILVNRILYSTMYNMTRLQGLDHELKLRVRNLMRRFPELGVIPVSDSVFKKVRLGRSSHFYSMVLSLCRLIHENILPAEGMGEYIFRDFTRNPRRMNRLFEAFVFNFYRKEQTQFPKVSRSQFTWNMAAASDEAAALLPRMHSDITLENTDRRIIIDAKYYTRTTLSYQGKEMLQPGNLYQIYSYTMNSAGTDPAALPVTGMLLYPQTNTPLDLEYKIENTPHHIRVCTVNLNDPWKEIEKRLLDLVRA
jgi:5-methylcytosine-specific restriction enzyme subunit McrC